MAHEREVDDSPVTLGMCRSMHDKVAARNRWAVGLIAGPLFAIAASLVGWGIHTSSVASAASVSVVQHEAVQRDQRSEDRAEMNRRFDEIKDQLTELRRELKK